MGPPWVRNNTLCICAGVSSVFTLPHRLGPHHCGGPGEPVGPQHGEAGAGLRGAGAVLGDALVDGVVVLADAVDGQRAAGERDTERSQLKPGLYHSYMCCIFTDTYLEEYGKYLFCPEGTKKMRENKGQGGPGQVPAPGQGKDPLSTR